MKAKKIPAVLLAAVTFITLALSVHAESSKDNMASTFELGAENSITVTASVNKAYTFIRNYGTTVSPIALEDDVFEQAYPYQCYGGGSNNRWDNIYKMHFDIPDAGDNDCVYLSYYYKSAVSFVGGDGNTYAGTTMDIQQQRNTTNQIVTNLKAGAYGDTFVADDQWHRVDLYMSGANIKEKELWIYFTDMSKPMYVLFAGFRAGVVHFADGTVYNNDRAYTELGWHLQNMSADTLTVNGKEIRLEPGVYEYSVESGINDIDVELDSSATATLAGIERLSVGKYELTLAAPGYNKALGADGLVEFRKRVNAGTDEFLSNGAITKYTVSNSQMMSKYIINLVMKSAQAEITVDGAPTTELDGCAGGEEIALNAKYLNVTGESKSYMAILVIYQDGYIKAVIPVREEIGAEVQELERSYIYTLPEGDYTGCSADCFVIDTAAMYEVAK